LRGGFRGADTNELQAAWLLLAPPGTSWILVASTCYSWRTTMSVSGPETQITDVPDILSRHDTVSERLRRWTRNPLGSARRGSNPLGVDLVELRLAYVVVYLSMRSQLCIPIAPTWVHVPWAVCGGFLNSAWFKKTNKIALAAAKRRCSTEIRISLLWDSSPRPPAY
jgi:hypothetical protein